MTKKKAPEDKLKVAAQVNEAETDDKRKGGAPKGNQFWRARSSHGRKPTFETADALWDACVEYFQWVEDNPLEAAELTTYQGISKVERVPKMRAMTITGLCIFLDIATCTWRSWAERKAKDKDFLAVTTRVDEIIRTQKFEGASGGFLNPNIIARDLGLADITKHQGDPDNPIVTKDVSDAELARRAAFLLRKSRPNGSSGVQANGTGSHGKLPLDS